MTTARRSASALLRGSLLRVYLIAAAAVREAFGQKVFQAILCLGIILVGGVEFFLDFDFGGSAVKFAADLGLGSMLIFGSLLAVIVPADLFFREIDSGRALTLLSKPILRGEVIVGKFLGSFMVLLVFTVTMTAILSLILLHEESSSGQGLATLRYVTHQEEVRYGYLALYGLLQWIKFGVICALTLFFASFATSHLFTLVMSVCAVAICQFQYFIQERWSDLGSFPVSVGALLVSHIFPNMHLFDISDAVFGGDPPGLATVVRIGAYGFGFIGLFLLVAVAGFGRREF